MTQAATSPRSEAATPIVIIMRKTQGSVWREAGRTELCPTLDWLRERHGQGEYELQLKVGNRMLCMVGAVARAEAAHAALPATSAARERTEHEGLGLVSVAHRRFAQR